MPHKTGMPKNLRSVSSMLLFNTNQNVYYRLRSGKIPHDRQDPTRARGDADEGDERLLQDAPPTTALDDMSLGPELEQFSYIPSIGEVPNLDLPSLLPDLQGIADDVTFEAESGPSIAPSLLYVEGLPDFPVSIQKGMSGAMRYIVLCITNV